MSGIKDSYIKLHEQDKNRLLKNCERIDDVDATIAERLAESAQRFREFLERHLPQLTETDSANSTTEAAPTSASSPQQALLQLEQGQAQALQTLTQRYQQHLQDLLQQPPKAQTTQLQQASEQLGSELTQQQHQIQQQVRALYQSQLEQRQGEEVLAEQWLTRLRALLIQLSQHEGLTHVPAGRLTTLDETLQQCDQYYQRGYYQAALATSHEAYVNALQAQTELVQAELIHATALQLAQYRLAAAQATADVQRHAKFRFNNGATETVIEADVDYWTEGKLTVLQEQLAEFDHLLNTSESLSTTQIHYYLNQIEQVRERILQLSADAQTALIASQLRHDIGQTIEQSLASAGWEVVDATYEQADYRRAMHIKLRNYQGDEMVTIIKPEAQAIMDAHLNIAFFELTVDEQARQTRLQQMTHALQQQGLQVAPPKCRPGTEQKRSPDRRSLDFNHVREQRQKGSR